MNSNYVFVVVVHFICTFVVLRTIFHVCPSFLIESINCGMTLASAALIGWFTFRFTKTKWLNDRVLPDGKAVLITGCDRGFGQALAIRLDSLGYHVFASCLSPSDPGVQNFKNKCSSLLHVLEMDVTKENSVQAALEFVKENLSTSELWAVVNNAGIFKGLSVEIAPLQDFEACLEVNTYGPLRVTKAFLPLLRKSKGRVINLTSTAGRIPIFGFTPYTVSKFATAGFTDCFRQEMDVWGVSVISVEPESYQTAMTDPKLFFKHIEENLSNLDKTIKEDYGEEYFKSIRKLTRIVLDLAAPKIEKVIDDLESAITLEYPDRVYMPCRNLLFKFLFSVQKVLALVVQDIIVKVFTFFLLFKHLKPGAI
ncbi:estradiol 17-beta-dehydrogenase 2-like [Parasteatoda tepidariorum]|uniref:estradiol 17-beta-dehydrogenase 2-like n=1 Tax=Parasteatoda tepidariorum TaxID=114398 RepID=UPI001C721988|nr:estradiol 17-beta-dehydrogenase 2-like isoform X2 [Parasteatoda tepidariorum]